MAFGFKRRFATSGADTAHSLSAFAVDGASVPGHQDDPIQLRSNRLSAHPLHVRRNPCIADALIYVLIHE